MRETGKKLWMPDDWNGGDIYFTHLIQGVRVEISRGQWNMFGCTKPVSFVIGNKDIREFAQGLLMLAPQDPQPKDADHVE